MGLMANAYRNEDIARKLSLDARTIERHINNIYSKLPEFHEARHQRVSAVMTYLRATGELAADPRRSEEPAEAPRPVALVYRRG